MVRIDFLILGYRIFKISPDQLSKATGMLLRAKIPSKLNNNGDILLRERDFEKAKNLFDGKIDHIVSESKGVYGIFKRTKNKKTIFAAILISVLLFIISGSIVWDVRVEGNNEIPDVKIEDGLMRSGFGVGKIFGLVNRGEVEREFLKNNQDISWININRRGTVAYVTVMENDNTHKDTEKDTDGYSNIIAEYDTVIEDITVKKGYAVVKIGDTVKKGDILISGAIPTDRGIEFCHAEGSVSGRLKEEITVELDREYVKRTVVDEEKHSMNVKIFDFSVNIFKKYGNQDTECDIIEDVKSFSLLGKCKLPIEITEKKRVLYMEEKQSYSDIQLVNAASRLLSVKTASRLACCDLLKLSTKGAFTDKGYRMTSVIVFAAEVGQDSPFTVE